MAIFILTATTAATTTAVIAALDVILFVLLELAFAGCRTEIGYLSFNF